MSDFADTVYVIPTELSQALSKCENLSNRDLIWDLRRELEIFNIFGRNSNLATRRRIAVQLKRCLFTKSPLTSNSVYIRSHLLDLTFTELETSLLKQEGRDRLISENIIADQIKNGSDPVLARILRNSQSMTNPFIAGFYQVGGKIKPIYGPRFFESKRQVPNTMFGGRDEVKTVCLIEAEFKKMDKASVVKSLNWNALPEELRNHFENGEILVTTGLDLYDLEPNKIVEVTKSFKTNYQQEIVREALENDAGKNKFYILYYGEYSDMGNGRTGVVMQYIDHELIPVKVDVRGEEYIVEVKGCGMTKGGFGDKHQRTGRDTVTGALEYEQAITEIDQLEAVEFLDGPKAAGAITFTSHDTRHKIYDHILDENTPFEQGYIIRLSPSTVRMSFTGADIYPDIETPEYVDHVLRIYSEQLAQLLFSDNPRIMDRSSHSENLLLWGDGKVTYTDYSDHVSLNDSDFPQVEASFTKISIKKMLEFYITMVDEIPGYVEERDKKIFLEHLKNEFFKYGIDLDFAIDSDPVLVTQELWEKVFAFEVYFARKLNGYFPEKAINHVVSSISLNISKAGFKDHSVVNSLDVKARIKLLDAYEILSKLKDSGKQTLVDPEEFLRTISSGTFGQVVNIVGRIMDISDPEIYYEKSECWALYESAIFYSEIYFNIFDKCNSFFDHELDLLESALLNTPESYRNQIVKDIEHLKDRIQIVNKILEGDLDILFETISDPEKVRELLTLDYFSLSSIDRSLGIIAS